MQQKSKCEDCESTNIYVLKDKTKVCRKCGWRGKSGRKKK